MIEKVEWGEKRGRGSCTQLFESGSLAKAKVVSQRRGVNATGWHYRRSLPSARPSMHWEHPVWWCWLPTAANWNFFIFCFTHERRRCQSLAFSIPMNKMSLTHWPLGRQVVAHKVRANKTLMARHGILVTTTFYAKMTWPFGTINSALFILNYRRRDSSCNFAKDRWIYNKNKLISSLRELKVQILTSNYFFISILLYIIYLRKKSSLFAN